MNSIKATAGPKNLNLSMQAKLRANAQVAQTTHVAKINSIGSHKANSTSEYYP
eukprot:CAMPEP_0169184214 /NCGR_PEP_ID=MMETSP1016-20121227/1099_1 /TAXON_ID=342587 /ORGANISM="Karlodinium micrum, Strain CCMP2283" /LENGTH=52 /DNA_ID=CAMNT_0009259747 /DNA_START=57 /DNA_END=211 /DNA_ORIENTATION=-